jgi:hypothetical protein
MQDVIDRKWRKYLLEVERPKDALRKYVATYILTIKKAIIQREDAMNFIRKIRNVTTVTKIAGGIEEEEFITGVYAVKFVLAPDENENVYLARTLKPQILEINGVRINSFKGVDRLD